MGSSGLDGGSSPRRRGFSPGRLYVTFVVEKVTVEQVFPRVLRFSPVNFIPPLLHYKEKRKKKLIIFVTGLHNKPEGCGVYVASAAGPLRKTTCSVHEGYEKLVRSFIGEICLVFRRSLYEVNKKCFIEFMPGLVWRSTSA